MKTIFIKIISLSALFGNFWCTIQAQSVYYVPSPNYVQSDTREGALPLELNFQFPRLGLSGGYNWSENYFVMIATNADFFTSTYNRGILSSPRDREKNNYGIRLGLGRQNLGAIGGFNKLEVLVSIEGQWANMLDYQERLGPDFGINIKQFHYSFNGQFSMTRVAPKSNFGLSLKLGYLHFANIKADGFEVFPSGSGNAFAQPGIHYHHTLSANRKLFFLSQFDAMIPFKEIEATFGDPDSFTVSTEYLLRLVLKVGIRYVFDEP